MNAPLMITIAQKTQPKAGGKTFKVTDTGGVQWFMWLDQWGNVQDGDMLRIESYKTKPFQGQDYNYIDKYQLVNGGADAGVPVQRPVAQTYPGRVVPQGRAQPLSAPRATESYRVGAAGVTIPHSAPTPYVAPPPQNKDKHIYVCGVINNLVANPNFIPDSLTKQWLTSMTQLAMSAYEETLGRKMITTGADLAGELNDELPTFEKAPF